MFAEKLCIKKLKKENDVEIVFPDINQNHKFKD
jgi:hypothetical protein